MKDRKFSTPVSMKVTKEQYEKDLKNPLEDLGYVFDTCNDRMWYRFKTLLTYYMYNNNVSNTSFNNRLNKNAHFIDHYNPKLFLALAAMTEGTTLIIGEYVMDTTDGDIFPMSSTGNIPDESDYRKATKEELINHFTKSGNWVLNGESVTKTELKEMMGKKDRFPFELDLEGVVKIIDCAYYDWRYELAKKWGYNMALNKPNLIDEQFYKEMRAACNDEQHKVLDSVFGKDKATLEEDIEGVIRYNRELMMSDGDLAIRLLETFDIKFKK